MDINVKSFWIKTIGKCKRKSTLLDAAVELFIINRFARAIKCIKVIRLKEELDKKLDEWRKRLLDVQKQSIRMAEERLVMSLEQKRQKLVSEMKLRKERHDKTFQIILKMKNDKLAEDQKTISFKLQKVEKFKEEQNKALERSRALARKTAELRDAIRSDYLHSLNSL